MSNPKKPVPNPLAQLREAERKLALAVVESAHTIGVVGTTVMQAVVARHRMACDAALDRIAGAAEEVQEMAREVTDAFVTTANSLRGDVEANEEPDLPALMEPAGATGEGPARLSGPAEVPEAKAQSKALAPRKGRKASSVPPVTSEESPQ